MNARAFEIAEHERDRALTARQLAAVEFVVGMGAEREKYTAQLARIDARLAALRGPMTCCEQGSRATLAPTDQPPCACESCAAARAYQYGGLHCCPRGFSHGMNCICGATTGPLPSPTSAHPGGDRR